jgi:hypothetical protein
MRPLMTGMVPAMAERPAAGLERLVALLDLGLQGSRISTA